MKKDIFENVTNNGENPPNIFGADAHDSSFEGSTRKYAEHLVNDHGFTKAQVAPYESGVVQGDWNMLDRLHRLARSLNR